MQMDQLSELKIALWVRMVLLSGIIESRWVIAVCNKLAIIMRLIERIAVWRNYRIVSYKRYRRWCVDRTSRIVRVVFVLQYTFADRRLECWFAVWCCLVIVVSFCVVVSLMRSSEIRIDYAWQFGCWSSVSDDHLWRWTPMGKALEVGARAPLEVDAGGGT